MKTNRSFTWSDTIDERYRKAKDPLLLTAFATVGIIYGDIGTSPLYVLNGIFPSDQPAPSPRDAMGAVSAIIWTLTLVPLIKYSLVALEFGTGEGEGGPFALFAQMYPPEKPGSELALPSIHSYGDHVSVGATQFLAKPGVKSIIKTITLFAVALIISDGILTPAVSVSSAVGGISIPAPGLRSSAITGISIAILFLIFFSQRFGTNKLGMSFAPIVSIWLLLLSGIGIYNIVQHPGILRAFDPSRAVMYFIRAKSITPLSGILLAITGVEALFANLGQFSKSAIRVSFISWIYPALILAYLGQGARLMNNGSDVISNIFYRTIPGGSGEPLWWIVFSFGLLATIVASQAMITASFSLIQQMVGFKSFPPVAIIHTSDTSKGQIYAPVVNVLLLIGTIAVTAGFGADEALTAAYGFAVSGVLLATTFLMTLVMIHVKGLPIWLALGFFLITGFIDALFFAASLKKIPHGAWFTLSLGFVIGMFLLFWTWAKGLEEAFDAKHRVKLSQLLIRYLPPSEPSPVSWTSGAASLDDKNQPREKEHGTETDRLRLDSPTTVQIPGLTRTPRELMITDLALHEEPEELQDSQPEIEEEKVRGDIYRSGHDVGPIQRVTISEPLHAKTSISHTQTYPPVRGTDTSGPIVQGNFPKEGTQTSRKQRTPKKTSDMVTINEGDESTLLTLNPDFVQGVTLSGPLPRLECFSFFHYLGEGIGAPHSFSAFIKHHPALPKVVVFLSVRVVGVPHLQEEDKYLIDKLRTVTGFYLMTYRVGYRDPLDLRALAKPTLERIIGLERGNRIEGTDRAVENYISQIVKASDNTNHILPHYNCTSKPYKTDCKYGGFVSKLVHKARAFLLETVYQRVSQNFPESCNYVVDESQVLRIGVNAQI